MKTENRTADAGVQFASLCESEELTLETTPAVGEYHEGKWLCVRFDCIIKKNGRAIWAGPYRMGMGHLKIPTKGEPLFSMQLYGDEVRVFYTLQRSKSGTPHKSYIPAYLSAIGKLANWNTALSGPRKPALRPTLAQVLSALIMDGEPFFQAMTFRSWCYEYGYDADSIKALETFRTCDATGRALAGALQRDTLDAMREICREL